MPDNLGTPLYLALSFSCCWAWIQDHLLADLEQLGALTGRQNGSQPASAVYVGT